MRPYGSRDDRDDALSPDLTRATTFPQESAERLRAVGAGEAEGEFYMRYGSPVIRAFESAVAAREVADGAVAFASGMAALHAIFCAGDGPIAVSRFVYGGTSALVTHDVARFGIGVTTFDPFDPPAFDGVRLVHVETPTNPLCRVVDVAAVAERAHAAGALLSVDATFAPRQRLRDHGADLVMHSATKFFGGHHDAMGGVVAGAHEQLEALEAFRRRTGGVLAPDVAWLLLRSMSTLELRARAAAETAARLAAFLEPKVARVWHPSLPSHPDHEVGARQMEDGGAMLAFEVAGGLDAAVRCYDRLRVIRRAVSLGGTETTAQLPIHTSHIDAALRAAAGVGAGVIRVSVGLEPFNDLAADLDHALS